MNNHHVGPTSGDHIHTVGSVGKIAELVHCGAVPGTCVGKRAHVDKLAWMIVS